MRMASWRMVRSLMHIRSKGFAGTGLFRRAPFLLVPSSSKVVEVEAEAALSAAASAVGAANEDEACNDCAGFVSLSSASVNRLANRMRTARGSGARFEGSSAMPTTDSITCTAGHAQFLGKKKRKNGIQ